MSSSGNDKPDGKRNRQGRFGWLRFPQDYRVVRITSAKDSLHAKGVEVSNADVVNERPLIRHELAARAANVARQQVN